MIEIYKKNIKLNPFYFNKLKSPFERDKNLLEKKFLFKKPKIPKSSLAINGYKMYRKYKDQMAKNSFGKTNFGFGYGNSNRNFYNKNKYSIKKLSYKQRGRKY